MKLFAIAIFLALLCIGTAKDIPCKQGEVLYEVDLRTGDPSETPTIVDGFTIEVIEPLSPPKGTPIRECKRQGVLKLTYPTPNVQSRMLQFDLEFDTNSLSGYAFHIGDSPTNRGLGGDAGTTSLNAEVFSLGQTWTVHADTEQSNQVPYDQRLNYITNHITITVGNEYTTFNNYVMPVLSYNGPHMLAALTGTSDYDIYFGMNRLIHPQPDGTFSGAGLCKVRITTLTCEVREGEGAGRKDV